MTGDPSSNSSEYKRLSRNSRNIIQFQIGALKSPSPVDQTFGNENYYNYNKS